MCNLYRMTKAPEAILRVAEAMQAALALPEGTPNIAPGEFRITDRAPIVRAAATGPGAELAMRRWSWPGQGGKPVYNFRSEGRNFSSGRCLAVADGFYEFTAPADPKAKRKHKWLFTLPDEPLFGIAGLWRTDPVVGEAWTMLTTAPGQDIAPYHNRQIVVLRPADWARWLDPAVPAPELLRPSPPGSLGVTQIA
jgi:putative SOS response-associated peptidase YedK